MGQLGRQGVVVSCFLLFVPTLAAGDIGLTLPAVQDEEVRGLRIGDFVFSPFLEVQGSYVSNLFRQAAAEGTSAAVVLATIPGFSLKNSKPSLVRLIWKADSEINYYFSDNPNAKDQGRFGASTDLRVDVLPRSVLGFFVLEQFRREALPPNFSSSVRYDRNYNHAETGLQIRPGGGALQFALSYAFNFMLYDKKEDMDFWFHEARLLGTWDLLPKTTVLLDADFQVRRWRKPLGGLRTQSNPLRVYAGMRGMITKKLGAVVRLGFGKGFYKEGTEFTNFIGEAGLGIQPWPSLFGEIGYRRGFEDSYYGNWYLGDTAYLKFGVQILRRVNLTIEGDYTYVQYASFNPAIINPAYRVNQASRRDHALRAKSELVWSLFRYLEVSVGYNLSAILTDFEIATPSGTDFGRYVVHEAYGGLRFVY